MARASDTPPWARFQPCPRRVGGTSAVGNPYMYTGRRLDPETGFYQFRTRYYDPDMGRFISRDTIGIWGDEASLGNGYAYAGNNPMTNTDSQGTWSCKLCSQANRAARSYWNSGTSTCVSVGGRWFAGGSLGGCVSRRGFSGSLAACGTPIPFPMATGSITINPKQPAGSGWFGSFNSYAGFGGSAGYSSRGGWGGGIGAGWDPFSVCGGYSNRADKWW